MSKSRYYKNGATLRAGMMALLTGLGVSACGNADEAAETAAAGDNTQTATTGTPSGDQAMAETSAPAEAHAASQFAVVNGPEILVATQAQFPDAQPVAVQRPNSGFTIGYEGTPLLPDGKWRVHDPERPRPEVVEPQTGVFVPPPSDAVVLFDGTSFDGFRTANDGAPDWVVENGSLRVPSDIPHTVSADIVSTREFGDAQYHIEWRSPAEPVSGSQGRGNSGIFLMGRYEVQVLDSYQNETYADGQASAIYGWKPPLKNATLPPGEWQSYDIVFEAPRFDDDGDLLNPAFVTVFHNGVLTQYRQNFLGVSGYQNILPYEAHPPQGPLRLQDHGNPVEYRNIWVRELDLGAND
ncbi:3-keto-disaccharide hydrolase [Aquisalinus flavus]|uniref:3-keto-alpha-glucoside-1,2-lyase/3-keto-2-hydroxy-glucal hydratase domain-containing protein n=1 Tax=Aquisalinus flavus TaxID=1526572 RepID=A0A8J2V5V6_9PROT|nr:DUF1080 domain-containing protein [Aquisalinus flavus]GGD11125.1 hypothetical protein GCM10011342_19900 [Aquisalinus flavus]